MTDQSQPRLNSGRAPIPIRQVEGTRVMALGIRGSRNSGADVRHPFFDVP